MPTVSPLDLQHYDPIEYHDAPDREPYKSLGKTGDYYKVNQFETTADGAGSATFRHEQGREIMRDVQWNDARPGVLLQSDSFPGGQLTVSTHGAPIGYLADATTGSATVTKGSVSVTLANDGRATLKIGDREPRELGIGGGYTSTPRTGERPNLLEISHPEADVVCIQDSLVRDAAKWHRYADVAIELTAKHDGSAPPTVAVDAHGFGGNWSGDAIARGMGEEHHLFTPTFGDYY